MRDKGNEEPPFVKYVKSLRYTESKAKYIHRAVADVLRPHKLTPSQFQREVLLSKEKETMEKRELGPEPVGKKPQNQTLHRKA